jgi:hypothetical protein
LRSHPFYRGGGISGKESLALGPGPSGDHHALANTAVAVDLYGRVNAEFMNGDH